MINLNFLSISIQVYLESVQLLIGAGLGIQ